MGGEGFKGSRTRYRSTGVISTWAWGLCFEYVLVINVLLFQWLAHYKKVAVKLLLVIKSGIPKCLIFLCQETQSMAAENSTAFVG